MDELDDDLSIIKEGDTVRLTPGKIRALEESGHIDAFSSIEGVVERVGDEIFAVLFGNRTVQVDRGEITKVLRAIPPPSLFPNMEKESLQKFVKGDRVKPTLEAMKITLQQESLIESQIPTGTVRIVNANDTLSVSFGHYSGVFSPEELTREGGSHST